MWTLILLGLAACAGPQTPAEHRAIAEQEREQAREKLDSYAEQKETKPQVPGDIVERGPFADDTGNPQPAHDPARPEVLSADAHLEHAKEHEKKALALELESCVTCETARMFGESLTKLR